MQPFRHTRLNHKKNEIRLIQITYDDQPGLACHLETFELDKCPEFVALSYEWGPPEVSESIIIDGMSLFIRINLWHCLKAIRAGLRSIEHVFAAIPTSRATGQDRKAMYIWCDQVCIDQHHMQERNHQVAMMRKIYSRAVETLAWLGPEALDAVEALSTDKYLNFETRGRRIHALEPSAEQTAFLSTFARRSYWSRLWIVQELMFSRKVHFVCGNVMIGWKSVAPLARGSTLPGAMHGIFELKPQVFSGRTSLSSIIEISRASNAKIAEIGSLVCLASLRNRSELQWTIPLVGEICSSR
jgi:hypothetical protein